MLLEAGQIESAKEKFNRILELNPDSAEAHFYLGEIALNNNEIDKAEELFNKTLQFDDTLLGPRFRLGQCALRKGRFDKAQSYLVSEMCMGPENPDVLVAMASTFLQMNQIDQASQCLLHSTDSDFTNAAAHYYLGLCCALRGRYEDAAEFFLHTLDLDETNRDAARDLAAAYYSMGRFDDAAQTIKEYRLSDSDSSFIKHLKLKIRLLRFIKRLLIPLNRLIPWRLWRR
jgi:tetratricopeptide (TPR) repeat protein